MAWAEGQPAWTRFGYNPAQPQPSSHLDTEPGLVDELLPIKRSLAPGAPSYSSSSERGYVITEPSDIVSARRAVADTYLYKGFVTFDEIDANGFICAEVDPHVDDSMYFGFGRNGQLAATARLIFKPTLEEFPAIKEFDIDIAKLQDLDLDPSKFAEISALAKVRGVGNSKDILHVYAQMMRHSLEGGQKYWLMSADSKLVGRLHQLFGADSFTQLGAEKMYMGSTTVPMAMDIHNSLRLYNKLFLPSYIKRTFTENLSGMDVSNLGYKEQKILKKHGVITDVTANPDGNKRIFTPENIGMAGLVAYSLARAVPVGALDDYGVNPYIFLGLDLATIPPYVMGTSKLVRSNNARDSLIGGMTAATSFAIPYAYLGVEGNEMPPLPASIIAGYMAVAGFLAVRRTRNQMQEVQEPEA